MKYSLFILSSVSKIDQEICEVSKATATWDLIELIEKFKLLERSGEELKENRKRYTTFNRNFY